jgi:hypothetical protein
MKLTDLLAFHERQVTQAEAIAIGQNETWKQWTADEIVSVQLFSEYLMMPFGVFHDAVNAVFGREVMSIEFADANALQAEYFRLRPGVPNTTPVNWEPLKLLGSDL